MPQYSGFEWDSVLEPHAATRRKKRMAVFDVSMRSETIATSPRFIQHFHSTTRASVREIWQNERRSIWSVVAPAAQQGVAAEERRYVSQTRRTSPIVLSSLCLAVRSLTRHSRGRASELESMGWRGARRCDGWLPPTSARGINASI